MGREMETYIRTMIESDCAVVAGAFDAQGWNKPESLYRRYLTEQRAGGRSVLAAFVGKNRGEFSGYVTIVWTSSYKPFEESAIPEIKDLNVLIKFRRKGIGTNLLDAAETLAAERSSLVGIGTGITPDYGPALAMYVKRGYIPDGLGAIQNDRRIVYGDSITVDDEPTLYLTKHLG